MKQVSIIIVTYNSEKDIYDCVQSIERNLDIPRENVELIVVDNHSNSPQSMFDRLRFQWGEDIILLENTHNGGYGQGNNIGIRCASAPVILIMNPDVRLACPFFSRPLHAFEADQDLLMFGMKQMYTNVVPSHSSFCCTYMMNGYIRTLFEGLCNRLEWYWPSLQYFSGSCFFVRKDKFIQIGLFDESVFMYGEEDDIHYRFIHRFGPHFRYDSSVSYIHLVSDRKPDANRDLRYLEVAMVQNEKKHYSRERTLKNFIRAYSVLLWREKFAVLLGKSPERLNEFKKILAQCNNLKRL